MPLCFCFCFYYDTGTVFSPQSLCNRLCDPGPTAVAVQMVFEGTGFEQQAEQILK